MKYLILFIVAVTLNNTIFSYWLSLFQWLPVSAFFDRSKNTEIMGCWTNLALLFQPEIEILRNSKAHRVISSISTLQIGPTNSCCWHSAFYSSYELDMEGHFNVSPQSCIISTSQN